MIKKLVLAILLAYSTSVSAQTSQVTSTGNLIDPNAWNGVIYMTPAQLAQVEGTGGGPIPAFNTGTNTIRFSFMPYTVSQIQAINSAMFNNNTNIQVSGYNYSWRLFGDNGSLNVSGKLYDTKGGLLESASYNYMFSPAMPKNWDLISGTSNFSTPYDFKNLGSFEVSATGSDSLFWSGYYGPRLRDVNVSFNYSILPAATTPTLTTTNTNTVVSDAIAEATNPVVTETPTTTSVATTTPITETVTASSTPTTSSTTTTSTSVATASPIAISPTSSSSTASTPSNTAAPSLSSVLTMIRSNQDRENNIAMSAVSQSNEVAKDAVAQAEQTALSVAGMSSSQSLDIAKDSMNSSSSSTKSNLANNGLTLLSPAANQNVSSSMSQSNVVQQSQNNIQVMQPPAQSVSAQQTASIFQLAPPVNNNSQPVSISPTQTTPITNLSSLIQQPSNNVPTGPIGLYTRPAEITISAPVVQSQEAQPLQENRLLSNSVTVQQTENTKSVNSLFARRGDPLTDYIEQNNILVAMAQTETKSTTVKTNVQDNDLAGGVRIERMAVTPVGFSVYSIMLRDAAFYQPKEIYKNVVIRDNVRTMYFIEKGNTDTYNKMLDQQYK